MDDELAVLQRLAERLQDAWFELGGLVQEEHPAVGARRGTRMRSPLPPPTSETTVEV